MNILKDLFSYKKKSENNNSINNGDIDNYVEIAKLVKESRIQKNLTIKELSDLSKIPEQTIYAIENNNKKIRPKSPFIRSILIKLEVCLVLKKNSLVKLAISEKETFKRKKKEFLLNKFDLINTWYGIILYFFILVSTIFILKRYFISNINVIEIQNIEKNH